MVRFRGEFITASQKRYDDEVKRDCVEMLLAGGRQVKPLAREPGIKGSTLRGWRQTTGCPSRARFRAFPPAAAMRDASADRARSRSGTGASASAPPRPTRRAGEPTAIRGRRGRSAEKVFLCDRHGTVPSMSAKGNCYDNAATESFWATLKSEMGMNEPFETQEDARLGIFDISRSSTTGSGCTAHWATARRLTTSNNL